MNKDVRSYLGTVLRSDGDRKLRRSLGDVAYGELSLDLAEAASDVFPQTKGVRISRIPRGGGRSNSYYNNLPSLRTTDGVLSGIPSRAVVAHELGHAADLPFTLKGKARAILATPIAPIATGVLGFKVAKKLGLSDEEAAVASLVPTAGMSALSTKSRLSAEFRASRNALKILRAYNKTVGQPSKRQLAIQDRIKYLQGKLDAGVGRTFGLIDPKEVAADIANLNKLLPKSKVTPVNIRGAKNALKAGLRTYKKSRTLNTLALATLPVAGVYAGSKLREYIANSKNKD